MTILCSFTAFFYFFLKKSVFKNNQGKSVPLAYCHKFSAPSASLNRRSLLSGFKNKGCADLGSICCYTVAAACLTPACAAPSPTDSSSLNTGNLLSSLNRSETQELLTPAGGSSLAELQHRES